MKEFITTSDGKIGFRREQYYSHQVGICLGTPEVVLYTTIHIGGKIIRYTTIDAAEKAGKEISEQLNQE